MASSKLLDRVAQKYKSKGISLTEKRQKILAVLLNAKQALSAYDIVDAYKEEFNQSIPAMSVYRILDFLMEIDLVHKLESVNQFLVCEHAACEHEHAKAQFLICDDCHSVQEISVDKSVFNTLSNSVANSGFSLRPLQLELHGTCLACSEN